MGKGRFVKSLTRWEYDHARLKMSNYKHVFQLEPNNGNIGKVFLRWSFSVFSHFQALILLFSPLRRANVIKKTHFLWSLIPIVTLVVKTEFRRVAQCTC